MDKLAYDLIPVEFDDLVLVAMNGAKKYSPKGWEKGFDKDKNIASIKRHINDFREGKLLDSESNLHPLLHAAFRCLMQYTLDKRSKNTKNLSDIDKFFQDVESDKFKRNDKGDLVYQVPESWSRGSFTMHTQYGCYCNSCRLYKL